MTTEAERLADALRKLWAATANSDDAELLWTASLFIRSQAAELAAQEEPAPWPFIQQAWRLTLVYGAGITRDKADYVIRQAVDSARELAAAPQPTKDQP